MHESNGYLPQNSNIYIYRLVSNIRRTSNISRTPTLGNSQLEFSPTISLAKTSNARRTPSFDFWVSIVDKVRSRPTWSELLRVAWDFDSPWIKGPMTPYQSRPYARHVVVIPAAKLCDSIAIVFLSIEVRIRHNLRRYIDGSAILFWLSRDPYDPDDQRFHHASRRKLCGIKRYFDKITGKSHQFVTKCPYQTIYSKHNICSYEFLSQFHDSFAGQLRNQIWTTWSWKIDK